MTDPIAAPDLLRGLLSPFGALRPQPISDWTGEGPLPPDLACFYAEVGPWGEDGPTGPSGLWIPSYGNDYRLPPLSRLWELQAGYRWARRRRRGRRSLHHGSRERHDPARA